MHIKIMNKNTIEELIWECFNENGLSVKYLLGCNYTQLEKNMNLINSYLLDLDINFTYIKKYKNLLIFRNNDIFINITLLIYDNCLDIFIDYNK